MANSDVLVRMQADTKNYDANIAKARRTLESFVQENLSLGGVMKQSTAAITGMAASVLSVTAAIGAAKKVIGDMVQINMQFEQSSSNLAAVMGKSRDEITALTDQAKQLGATTQYTANQILELQANLARLGFNENEIKNSTAAVQAMATAMGADLGEAANLAGSALRGFGMNATEMERVASVLSVGTTKSALSFEKLATALPIVQTAAAKTGFTIEDTVAMLGKLTDNGINAASAATQLRKILNDSTTAGTKLANALGGPVKSFDELVVALDKANKAGQNHADSVALVNSKNATALDILRDMAAQRTVEIDGVQKQTSALQDLRNSITDCSDGMKAMQDEQLNTLQGSITILNSAWEGLMLTFSESNGTIKKVVDSLSELLQAWTKWRNRNAGGDSAIQTYEMSDSNVAKYGKQYIEADRAAGMSDSAIKKNAEAEKAAIEAERDAMKELLAEWEKVGKLGWGSKEAQALMPKVQQKFKVSGNAYKWTEQMQKQIAQKNDNAAIQDYIISSMTAPSTGKVAGAEGAEGGGGKDKGKSRLATLKAQYEEQEKAQIASLDRMAMNEADYEAQVYKIKRETLQKIADLYQEETAEKARANAAISQLDIAYQGTQMRLANKANSGSGKDPELTALEKRNKRIQELTASIAEMNNILATSTDANEKAWATNQLQAYNDELDRLNGKLKETATNVTELPTKFEMMQEALDNMSTGVGAISTIGNAFNDLKGIGEDLASAFSGEMDAWDSLMTVFNSGIGIMQTVIGVMEAINTLQELGNALSDAKVAKQAAETTAVVSGKGAEAAAETAEAAASGTATAANTAEAAAGAGKAMAGIPIVGPVLAVAAIAAVLAAVLAATSKAKSAGSFATGGIVPGNNYNDGLVANVSSGELILNRAQQGAIAGQLQGAAQQTVVVEGRISGKDILLSANNTNRAAGGSRGYYAKVH